MHVRPGPPLPGYASRSHPWELTVVERCVRVGDLRRGLDCVIDHVEVLRVPHLLPFPFCCHCTEGGRGPRMTSYQPSGTGNELHPLRGMEPRLTKTQKTNQKPSATRESNAPFRGRNGLRRTRKPILVVDGVAHLAEANWSCARLSLCKSTPPWRDFSLPTAHRILKKCLQHECYHTIAMSLSARCNFFLNKRKSGLFQAGVAGRSFIKAFLPLLAFRWVAWSCPRTGSTWQLEKKSCWHKRPDSKETHPVQPSVAADARDEK